VEKRELSEFITSTVSGGQNELTGKFKMAAGNVIGIDVVGIGINCCHLHLTHQFILSFQHSPFINL
jgi:hypothetical protein